MLQSFSEGVTQHQQGQHVFYSCSYVLLQQHQGRYRGQLIIVA